MRGKWPISVRSNGKVGLVGFSMGGLTTLLAAASLSPPVDAWVGLDPVTLRSAPPPSGVPYAKISDSFPPKTAPVGNCRRGSVLIVAATHL